MKTLEQFIMHWAYDGVEADRFLKVFEPRDAEWRRLVEEAKAEAKVAGAWRDSLSECLIKVESERDRLKGELAEARRRVERGIELLRRANRGTLLPRALRDNIVDYISDGAIAAPPAEQAQPTSVCVKHRAATCSFCLNRGLPFTFEAAEQAQGEGAPVLSDATTTRGTTVTRWNEPSLLGHCGGCTPENPSTVCNHSSHIPAIEEQVAEITKRVEALTDRYVADERGRALMWNEHETRIKALEPAPPPPEAAVPEHAFVDDDRGDCVHCGDGIHASAGEAIMPHTFVPTFDRPGPALCGVPGCGRIEREHAVPPIPEGTR